MADSRDIWFGSQPAWEVPAETGINAVRLSSQAQEAEPMTEPEKSAVEATAEIHDAVERLRALLAAAAEADTRASGASAVPASDSGLAPVTS